jgi:hypothetical protein
MSRCFVRRPDGSYLEAVHLPELIIAPYAGPEGWRDAILGILDGMT